jgi:hypothetical protein
MANIRNRMVIVCLLGMGFLLFQCATQEETLRPQKPLDQLDLEFAGNRIELQNPLPRNGEEVEVIVIVRNRGNQDARRIPVFFYDNLRVFSTEEIDLEPGGQRRLTARWRATSGSHTLSVIIDPARHFKGMIRERSEVSRSILVK